MVKFGEDDSVYQVIMSFLFDLSKNADSERRVDSTPSNPSVSQTLSPDPQDSEKDHVNSSQKELQIFSTIPFSKDPNFVGREEILTQIECEFANPKTQNWASLYGLGGIG